MTYNKGGEQMTSKEALNILFINTKGTENYSEVVEARNKIEEDLETLYMLKEIIYEETRNRIDKWLNNK